jgi:hypothetical protein
MIIVLAQRNHAENLCTKTVQGCPTQKEKHTHHHESHYTLSPKIVTSVSNLSSISQLDLINVPKIQILLIRQIPKRSRVQIAALQTSLHRALDLVSTLILSR